MINHTTHFDPQAAHLMEEYVQLNEELKKIEAKKKTLSDSIKKVLTSAKIDEVNVNGTTLSLSESTRKTVTKATKDEFVAALVGLGKKHLIKYSIEPDVDSIFAEVDAGTIDKVLVDTYVKVTPVVTLRCN